MSKGKSDTHSTLSSMHHYGLNRMTFATNGTSWSCWATHRSSLTRWQADHLNQLCWSVWNMQGRGSLHGLVLGVLQNTGRDLIFIWIHWYTKIWCVYTADLSAQFRLYSRSHVCQHYFFKCGPYQPPVGTGQGQMWPAGVKNVTNVTCTRHFL